MVMGGWGSHTHTKLNRVSGVERFHWFLNERWINREDFRDVRRQPNSGYVGVLFRGSRISKARSIP
jgi:hypothetical protein